MASAGAGTKAAIAAFGITAILYAVTASFAPSWPPQQQPSMAGLWLLDAIARIPLGDAVSRAVTVAVLFAALTSALTTIVMVRLGYQPIAAMPCAVTLAGTPAVWLHATGDVTGALASLLVAVAVALSFAEKRSLPGRTMVAIGLFLIAIGLGAVRLETAPTTWRQAAGFAVALLRDEWRLPITALIVVGLAAPLWAGAGARAPVLPIVGTGVAFVLATLGRNVAAFAPFAAILMVHGLSSLPAIGTRARAVVAIALVLATMTSRWQERRPPAWLLLAWRDALERTLPAGAVITTSNRAAAALQFALFSDRPSGIELRLWKPGDSPGSFALDDLRPQQPRTAVTLAFANPLDAIGRLPRGTIVGLAVTSPAIADNAPLVNAALQAIGWPTVTDAPRGVAAIGITGTPPAAPVGAPPLRDTFSAWLGEPIGHTGRRSPTDVDVRVNNQGASIRMRGRDVVTSDAWAAIALDRHGRIIATWVTDDTSGTWPLDVKGLNVWR